MKIFNKKNRLASILLLSATIAEAQIPSSSTYANMSIMDINLVGGGNDISETGEIIFNVGNESTGLPGTGIISVGSINYQVSFPSQYGLAGTVGGDTPSPELVTTLDAQGWSIDYIETGASGTIRVINTVAIAEGEYLPLTLPVVGFELGEGYVSTTVDRNSPIVVGNQSIADDVLGNDFTVVAIDPLPVSLINFTAIKQDKTSLLEWTTVSEQGNKGFGLQRSADGYNWNSIGFVNSMAVNGNSSEQLNYTYTDNSPLEGINYYRLHQVDFDGKNEYSQVRNVNFGQGSAIKVYPNPATDDVTISGLIGNETLIMSDALGRKVTEQQVASDKHVLQVNGLTKGVYHLQIFDTHGSTNNLKIVVD